MVETNLKNRLKNNLANFTEPEKARHNNAEPQLSVPEFVVKARARCGQSTGRLWSIHGRPVVNARRPTFLPAAACCGQSTVVDARAVRSCGQGVERLMAHDHRGPCASQSSKDGKRRRSAMRFARRPATARSMSFAGSAGEGLTSARQRAVSCSRSSVASAASAACTCRCVHASKAASCASRSWSRRCWACLVCTRSAWLRAASHSLTRERRPSNCRTRY